MDLENSTARFWSWWERVLEDAPKTAVGQITTAAGFRIDHTGGGCLAWGKNLAGKHYVWITDTSGGGLGDTPEDEFTVGLYNDDGDPIDTADVLPNLQAALDWAEAREIVVRWFDRFGLGYHPDTRGADYVDQHGARSLTDEEAAAYDRDIDRLFAISPHPYAVGITLMDKVVNANE